LPDETEFSAFVSQSYRTLVRYGVSLLADRGKAEDLVQTSLVKTYRSWHRLDGGPAVAEGYTKKVMARAAWRASRRRWRAEVPAGDLTHFAQASDDAFAAMDNAGDLRRALSALPDAQRVVLVLRYLDGLSERETADRLGCAAGTVKSRAARGIETLRRMRLIQPDDDRGAP